MLNTPAPICTLVDTDGRPFPLAQAWANGPAILVFYPGDFTPVCTKQLCSYRDRHGEFAQLSATVIGINPGPGTKHKEFTAQYGFPFILLSDPDKSCCAAFGAKAWYGIKRLVVVVDTQGVIRYYRSVLPFTHQSVDELLSAARSSQRRQ